jgi:hypothetical protein
MSHKTNISTEIRHDLEDFWVILTDSPLSISLDGVSYGRFQWRTRTCALSVPILEAIFCHSQKINFSASCISLGSRALEITAKFDAPKIRPGRVKFG